MFNNVQLIGRLGSAIEVRETQSAKVANVSICTEISWKDKDGEWQRKPTWHRLVIWNPKLIAYMQNNLDKGALIQVQGELTYQDWTDNNDVKRHDAVIKVDTVLNLQPGKKDDAQQRQEHDEIPY